MSETIIVHNMFSPGLSLEFSCIELVIHTNNLSSYCGLVDAKIRASDKVLPVQEEKEKSTPAKPKEESYQEKIFTREELKKYDGSEGSPGIYLAMLGQVFDVSKAPQFYGPEGGYGFFAGRDASRAFVTGDFDEEGLIDDVAGLSSSDYIGLDEWIGLCTYSSHVFTNPEFSRKKIFSIRNNSSWVYLGGVISAFKEPTFAQSLDIFAI